MSKVELNNMELQGIFGGIQISDGDGCYLLKKSGAASYNYTFAVADFNKVLDVFNTVNDPALSRSENDDKVIAALLAAGLIKSR